MSAETAIATATDNSVDETSTIETLVDSIQNQNWDTFTDLMSYEDQDSYAYYFNDSSYTDGIKQVENMKLDSIKALSNEQVSPELETSESSILEATDNIKAYLVGLDCTVSAESEYFYNGLNYYLVVFAEESDGTYKIAQFNKASYSLLDDVIGTNLTSSDNEYQEKEAALTSASAAAEGCLINSDGKFITDGYDVLKEDVETGEITEADSDDSYDESESTEAEISKDTNIGNNIVDLLSFNNSRVFINTAINFKPHINFCADIIKDKIYLYYSVPTTVTTRTRNGKIHKVSLTNYIKNTLPNEWGPAWNMKSLKAGAYAVKAVAIYRSIKPRSTTYDLDYHDQNYVSNSTYSKTNKATNAISSTYMINSSGYLFYAHYHLGTENIAGTKGAGTMSQYGSLYLATKKDYSVKQILNYYYQESSCSKDALIFINYGSC